MPRAHALSYVIPARNAGVTLLKTLESLLEQTTPNWCAVVVDDGSTDDTASLAQATNDPRITTIRGLPRGVALARETGVEALLDDESPVCFLDADDWVEPDHASSLLNAIDGHDVAACGYAMVDEDGADLDFQRTPDPADFLFERQLQCNRFLVGTVAVSRTTLNAVITTFGSLFDASLRCEDWDFWLRVAQTGARWAAPIDRPLLNYRQSASSRSSALREMYRDNLKVIQIHATDSQSATRAQRKAVFRVLAQAIACCDNELVQAVLADLGCLEKDEHDHLASALRWALLVRERSRFAAGDVPIEEIAKRIDCALGSTVDSLMLAQQAGLTDSAWRRVARRAFDELNHGQTLVVYGLGQNGRLVLQELLAIASGRIAWMDDGEPSDQSIAPRMQLQDLDDRHVVLITPDDRAPLLSRLQAARPARVILPEQLQPAVAHVASAS